MADLTPGEKASVSGIRTNGLLRRRLVDLGFIPGAEVRAVHAGPSGDPIVYEVKGSRFALRLHDASQITISPDGSGSRQQPSSHAACKHCIVGSSPNGCGVRQVAGSNNDVGSFVVALAGNPNTGKSTIFNALTGLRQHVGNWPGKTVARAEGSWQHREQRFKVVDLPGTYSLLSTSTEEEIARDFVLFGAPDVTVIVADATALERNLNLVLQIIEITDRAILCVNLIDEARRWGIRIEREKLAEQLGIPVTFTAARSGRGMSELRNAIFDVATGVVQPTPKRTMYEPEFEAAVNSLAVEIGAAIPSLPNARWVAMRLIDGGDDRLREELERGQLASLAKRFGEGPTEDASPTPPSDLQDSKVATERES